MKLTFPEIMSVLLKCLPRPRLGVLHVPLVINSPRLRRANYVGGANLCFPLSSISFRVSDFCPHGYEVIGSVARPSSVEVAKTLTIFKHRIGRL